jgi:hypothetical protein
MRVGSVDHIISPGQLRPFVIRALERRLARPEASTSDPLFERDPVAWSQP